MDDRQGLRFVEATTPFERTGSTRGATAILEAVGGAGAINARLVRVQVLWATLR